MHLELVAGDLFETHPVSLVFLLVQFALAVKVFGVCLAHDGMTARILVLYLSAVASKRGHANIIPFFDISNNPVAFADIGPACHLVIELLVAPEGNFNAHKRLGRWFLLLRLKFGKQDYRGWVFLFFSFFHGYL